MAWRWRGIQTDRVVVGRFVLDVGEGGYILSDVSDEIAAVLRSRAEMFEEVPDPPGGVKPRAAATTSTSTSDAPSEDSSQDGDKPKSAPKRKRTTRRKRKDA